VPIHIKSILFGLLTAAVFSVLASNGFAQHSGPAALAAKQAIKNQVVAAMSDGKITEAERRSILLKANEVCSEREYMGLVDTMNRLSPPENVTPESSGHARYVDKQLIAQFPSGDIPLLDNLPNQLPILKSYSKQLAARDPMPKQNYVVRETVTKQPMVQKTVPYQSFAQTTTTKPSGVKSITSNKVVAKPTVQTQNASQKAVSLPSPLTQQRDIKRVSTLYDQVDNKISKIDKSASDKSATETRQTGSETNVKSVKSNVVKSQKKQPVTGNGVSLQQPDKLWDKAEKSAIRTMYTDYSIPVLNTPTAALLTDGNGNTIRTSYNDLLGPEIHADCWSHR
jgi:hypothetical protein